MGCVEKIQRGRTSPCQLASGRGGEGSGSAGAGPKPSPSLRSFCPGLHSLFYTHAHIQVELPGSPNSDRRRDLKGLVNPFQKTPESASRGRGGERSQGPRRRLCTCLLVRVFPRVAGSQGAGPSPRAGVPGCSGLRPQFRVGLGEEGAPQHAYAPEPQEPRRRESGAESHPSSGALQRRPGGAWLHVGLGSTQARSLGARLSAAAAFCDARRRNGSSRGTRPPAWVSRGRRERVSRTQKRLWRPGEERRALRARGERPCPAPGALSAFLAWLVRSLAPSSSPFLPGPCLLPRSPAG